MLAEEEDNHCWQYSMAGLPLEFELYSKSARKNMFSLLAQFVASVVALIWAPPVLAETSVHLHNQLRGSSHIPIHFFNMQRDEGTKLLDWFNYHATLAGNPGNVHVIDNNSKDPYTLRVLAYIRRQGGEVMQHDKFDQAGKFTELMRRYVNESAFLIPLDGNIVSVFGYLLCLLN